MKPLKNFIETKLPLTILLEYLVERMIHGLSSPFNKEPNWKIKQKNLITYIMGLVLSNKYLAVIIKCQKPMIFD